MRGHIRKRGKTWSVIVPTHRDPKTGEWRYKWTGGFATERAAEKALPDLLKKTQSGELEIRRDGPATVAQFLRLWLADRKVELKPTTTDVYARATETHLIPSLGRIRLDRLRPAHVRDFREAKLKELTPTSVGHCMRALSNALRYGVRHAYVGRHVAEAVEMPRTLGPFVK